MYISRGMISKKATKPMALNMKKVILSGFTKANKLTTDTHNTVTETGQIQNVVGSEPNRAIFNNHQFKTKSEVDTKANANCFKCLAV